MKDIDETAVDAEMMGSRPAPGRDRVQLRLGLLAAGAALAGALIGSLASFAGIVYQAQSERELAFRHERQVAYVEMNVGFARFMSAARADVCARYEDLRPLHANVLLIGSTEVSVHADIAVNFAQSQCVAVGAGREPNAEDVKHFRESAIAFMVAAQEDLLK